MDCHGDGGGIKRLLSEPAGDAVDLSAMTKAELLAYAAENGITGVSSSMLKADIYNTIINAQEG